MKKNNYFFIFIIWFSSIIWGLINYFYYPLMLKFLSLEEFWIFSSLIWIFNILWVFMAWADLFLNKKFSENLENKEKNKQIFLDSLKIFWVFWIISFFIFALFSPLVADFLKINDYFLIIFVWLVVVFSYFSVPLNPLLRSLKNFEIISLAWVIWPILKLFFWVLFLFFGLKIYWAIWGFIVSWFLLVFYLFYFSYKNLKNIEYKSNINWLLKDFYENKIEIFNFFLVAFLFSIFMNFDIILARNFFSEIDAWIYAWISVLWKFLLFLVLSIETVYFWQIMEHKKEKIPFHLVRNPIILMIFLVFSAILFNYFFWKFILWILDKNLVEFEKIYLLNLVYYWFLAILSFIIKILIWWKIYKINILISIFLWILIFSLYNFWNNLYNFALIYAIFLVVFTIILAIIFFLNYKKWKQSF